MERADVIVIGGGAAGLVAAARLSKTKKVILLERGERVGKKLSATGNGQGNVSNEHMDAARYFSSEHASEEKLARIFERFGKERTLDFLTSLGGLFFADERGRIYPSGKQASAVTDLLRFHLTAQGGDVRTGRFVKSAQKADGGFFVAAATADGEETFFAENLVLCTGGKAAKNFGTDGNGYELARAFSHTVTPLYPSLVQLKTDTSHIRSLKGIRAACNVCARVEERAVKSLFGDVIFTDYGVSGDAIFRISAFLTDRLSKNAVLTLDFLPEVEEGALVEILRKKRAVQGVPETEIFCGILNNQIGRCVLKRAGEGASVETIAKTAKAFTLVVTGSLGFDYAQVTKGGVPLSEVDENLQSKKVKGLYLAGEILDIDGECGGYNLQWAFSSAFAVAAAIGGA